MQVFEEDILLPNEKKKGAVVTEPAKSGFGAGDVDLFIVGLASGERERGP